jgi:3-methyladenine DNA glycosylase AlkD
MDMIGKLIQRVERTRHGFKDIRAAADEVMTTNTPQESFRLARNLFVSDVRQARMLATFIFGRLGAASEESLTFLRNQVSQDTDWRVQEVLAQAFDRYCSDIGYEKALPIIRDWIEDPSPNVRRAVTEGLRIWTSRPYFRDHPDVAIQLLSQLRQDESEYVRKSVGNALRDVSKKQSSYRIRKNSIPGGITGAISDKMYVRWSGGILPSEGTWAT